MAHTAAIIPSAFEHWRERGPLTVKPRPTQASDWSLERNGAARRYRYAARGTSSRVQRLNRGTRGDHQNRFRFRSPAGSGRADRRRFRAVERNREAGIADDAVGRSGATDLWADPLGAGGVYRVAGVPREIRGQAGGDRHRRRHFRVQPPQSAQHPVLRRDGTVGAERRRGAFLGDQCRRLICVSPSSLAMVTRA